MTLKDILKRFDEKFGDEGFIVKQGLSTSIEPQLTFSDVKQFLTQAIKEAFDEVIPKVEVDDFNYACDCKDEGKLCDFYEEVQTNINNFLKK